MPNYDAGHYFLTVFAPIRLDSVLIDGQSHARRHLIREVLADLPTGERTVASKGKGNNSPFARSFSTHFVRMFVLDDVVFNGRSGVDTLWSKLRKTNLLKPQPVDRLSTPFLVLSVDFDAANGGESELNAYLTDLWGRASTELTEIFQHCVGFESTATARDFCRYIQKCQIETTMPFNDYWSVPPTLPDLSLTPYIAGAGAAAVIAIAGLLMHQAWLVLVGLLGLLLAVYLGYRKVMEAGQEPFPKSAPPAPGPDLPTVLKALYLQRGFTAFAIDAQGQSDRDIFDAFGKFVAENRPDEIASPTQEPGVIGV
jgi:hypothetical protein